MFTKEVTFPAIPSKSLNSKTYQPKQSLSLRLEAIRDQQGSSGKGTAPRVWRESHNVLLILSVSTDFDLIIPGSYTSPVHYQRPCALLEYPGSYTGPVHYQRPCALLKYPGSYTGRVHYQHPCALLEYPGSYTSPVHYQRPCALLEYPGSYTGRVHYQRPCALLEYPGS